MLKRNKVISENWHKNTEAQCPKSDRGHHKVVIHRKEQDVGLPFALLASNQCIVSLDCLLNSRIRNVLCTTKKLTMEPNSLLHRGHSQTIWRKSGFITKYVWLIVYVFCLLSGSVVGLFLFLHIVVVLLPRTVLSLFFTSVKQESRVYKLNKKHLSKQRQCRI